MDALQIKTLINQGATRANVISAFRTHLSQSGPDDVALFCYSGHGSQEPAPEEFWHLEPDHLDETLVCYDSRMPGSWDLADKELAKLITEVSKEGSHVVVVLDCCHSGSGTRAPDVAQTAVRRIETDRRKRPLDSFLFAADSALATLNETTAGRDLSARPSGWNFRGRHVLLAACHDDEEAKEYQGGDVTRGAFSYFLGETLRTVGAGITYRELFARTAALVRGEVQRQSPQLEATNSQDLLRPFLGGAIKPSPRYFVASVQGGRWSIDGGRIHGIPAPTPDDVAALLLFDYGVADNELNKAERAVGKARITEVLSASSRIEVEGVGSTSAAPLKGVIVHLPIAKLRVKIEGHARGVDLARGALATASPDGGPSLFVRESLDKESADFRLLAQGEQYVILKPEDDRPLVQEIDGYAEASAKKAISRLEHIERWKTTAELKNPNSSIGADELQVQIFQGDSLLEGKDFRLEYVRDRDGQWMNPEIKIQVKNAGNRRLYVALLDLPETFGIFPVQGDVGCQKLEPGQETLAHTEETIPLTIPDEFWQTGLDTIKDILKVIVSTSEFDARRMAQEDLDLPRSRAVTRSFEDLGTLERLMERVQTRHAGGTPRRIDDWQTQQVTLTTVRPLAAHVLEPGRATTLSRNVRIEPHSTLRVAEVRVGSLPVASRSICGLSSLPHLLYDDPTVVQPFEFSISRGGSGVLSTLEFRGVNDPTLVTPENPLRVMISRLPGTGEHVLPVGFDGEFFLPLGRAELIGTETRVVLDRLPQPDDAASRSLGGALRIFFQKVISRIFKTEYRYPILAVAETDENLKVSYQPDLIEVRERVKKAQRIALFVHGIIADTRDMAASLTRAGVADGYDLVLTFDYENLNDPIGDTARSLKQRLEDAGLGPNHGKALDLFAHSMGGLVSRWFIEREGGHRVVTRLIMLGTPNNGSPWPRVQDWATTALAFGLNGLSHLAWPASVLGGLVRLVESIDVTLDQMLPNSSFVRDLYASPDPNVPYTLVAGDTSLIGAPAAADQRRSSMAKLLGRMWSDQTKYRLATVFFSGYDNDIAVSVNSMGYMPSDRRPACDVRTLACDHMSYFSDREALLTLAELVGTRPGVRP
jgi:pimeloyl-ACP methyl ester carboxylesterase